MAQNSQLLIDNGVNSDKDLVTPWKKKIEMQGRKERISQATANGDAKAMGIAALWSIVAA